MEDERTQENVEKVQEEKKSFKTHKICYSVA